MRRTLAIDAGGTSTRAALVDDTGGVLGFGRAASGNPTASGVERAAAQLADAASTALDEASTTVGPGSIVVVTQAGQASPAYRAALDTHFGTLGFDEVVVEPDLLGMYGSGTPEQTGAVLIAGTGSVAGRIEDGALVQEVGGAGWLLGDGGSGFWIARRIVRAVAADLDGLGPATALTPLLVEALGLPAPGDGPGRRSSTLDRLIHVVHEDRPVSIARVAPLAFAAVGDPVAATILREAISRLSSLVRAVHPPGVAPGTLVLGGSVLVDGLLVHEPTTRERLHEASRGADLVTVRDGLVGAACLGLRRLGIEIDDAVFERLCRALTPPTRMETP
ncbi:hypothetical protein KXS11_03555 [Plantibacter flavus]|uniref:N-acetylglucosamine kinase n=1 Tax=Plantibacter flavus TaxID=150123 RepID=UPI003F16035C